MNLRQTIPIGAVLVSLLLVGLGWFWLGDATPPPPTPAAAAAANRSDGTPDPAMRATDSGSILHTPAAAPPPDPISPAPRVAAQPPTARIVGRCIDEHGSPLAAATVKLRVHQQGVLTQPPIEQQTGGDGRFEFAFEPRPGQSFWLYATAEARIGQQAYWPGFTAGERFDCGTFVMTPGIVVRGRVEDTNHAPVANVSLQVGHGPPGASHSNGPGRTLLFSTRTGADGSFATAGALPAGEFTIRVSDDQQPQPPTTGVLVIERPVEFVTIVVPAIDPSEWITGTVVDQRGSPLAGASVDAGDGGSQAMTRSDGSFRMRRSPRASPRQMVQLHVRHEDHGYQAVGPEVAWGNTRIELRMLDGNSLELLVRDQDGRPVEDFTITLSTGRNQALTKYPASKHRAGPFPGGIASLKGVQLGPMAVLIEFGASAPHPSRLLALDLAAQHTRLDVLAEPMTTRTLEVVDGNGQAMAGVTVVLCDPVDGEFLPGTPVVAGPRILRPQFIQALLLQTTTTDATGRAALRGPGTRDLGVRLPGPGHQPTQLANVTLAVPEPLRLEVRLGAHLVGKLGPLDAVEFLRGLAGDTTAQQRTPLRLLLQRPDHDPKAPQPPVAPLAADGSFELRGLLPGTYTVSLQHARGYELLGDVTMVDGRTTRFEVEIPVALMTPGTLTGRVMQNGQPVAGARVLLLGTCAAVNGRTRQETGQASTDPDGRFLVHLRPGSYRATVGLAGANLLAAETAVVSSRATTEQDFTLATGTLQVTLRSATGTAVPEVTIFDTAAEARQTLTLPRTDTTGNTTLEVSVGTIHLRTLPKHLQSIEARSSVLMQGGWAAFDGLWIPLGSAEVRAGATATVELRLPADWDR